jgi:hypothetical protein
MEVLYPRCCGLDVHKSTITACVAFARGRAPNRFMRPWFANDSVIVTFGTS